MQLVLLLDWMNCQLKPLLIALSLATPHSQLFATVPVSYAASTTVARLDELPTQAIAYCTFISHPTLTALCCLLVFSQTGCFSVAHLHSLKC